MDRQYVAIDHQGRRSVVVRMSATGNKLSSVRIASNPMAIAAVAEASPEPEVVVEATSAARPGLRRLCSEQSDIEAS